MIRTDPTRPDPMLSESRPTTMCIVQIPRRFDSGTATAPTIRSNPIPTPLPSHILSRSAVCLPCSAPYTRQQRLGNGWLRLTATPMTMRRRSKWQSARGRCGVLRGGCPLLMHPALLHPGFRRVLPHTWSVLTLALAPHCMVLRLLVKERQGEEEEEEEGEGQGGGG